MQSNTHKYRPDIDGLRAVAVLAVLAYHAFPETVQGGFIGVDIFFVISGFLISAMVFDGIAASRFSIVDFYRRRIRRIFPALLVVLCAVLVAGWFMLLGVDYALLGKHVAAGAGFCSNLILWLEADYFDLSAELKPLLHLWSLGIEEQYYMMWPALMWLLWKPGRNLYKPLSAMLILSLGLCAYQTYTNKTLAFYSPFTRFWEILVGSILAYAAFRRNLPASRQSNSGQVNNLLSVMGVALISIGFGITSTKSAFPGWLALLPALGAALIIAGGSKAWFNSKVLSRPILVWIGLISFPLYLWHWPLLSLARIETGHSLASELRWGLLALSFLLAWLTYRFVERPLRYGRAGNLITVLLLSLMMLLGCVGYLIYKTQGFPNRFPEIIRTATSYIPFSWGDRVRSEVCHLHLVTSTVHRPECFETKRPLVALWGDSHAASLYPGLKNLQDSESFGIIQVNQSACPPLLGVSEFNFRHNCKQVNDDVIEKLIAARPEVFLLHGTWWRPVDPLSDQTIYQGAAQSARTIKERIPSARVIILGPVPRWDDSPQKEIYRAWKSSLDKRREPPVMLEAKILKNVEQVLAKVAADTGVEYISLSEILCNEEGRCMSRVGSNPLDIIATDDGHLSPNASIFLINKIKDRILTAAQRAK
jgi:peptidoglycan/LPS O-acetylase OafA/YrhL